MVGMASFFIFSRSGILGVSQEMVSMTSILGPL